jgi:hypothetical protein
MALKIDPKHMFQASGGFSDFVGTVVEVDWAAYAYYGKDREKTEGFFLRWLILPDEDEPLVELLREHQDSDVLERFYSGGGLEKTIPGTGSADHEIVNLASNRDEDLRGPFAHPQKGRHGIPGSTNVAHLFDHLEKNTNFDDQRGVDEEDIRNVFLGMRCSWTEIDQPEREFKGARRRRKKTKDDEEERKPTLLVPDKILEYFPHNNLPARRMSGGRGVASSMSDGDGALLVTFIQNQLANGPVAKSALTNALIAAPKDPTTGITASKMPAMLSSLSSPGWLEGQTIWTVDGDEVSLA